MPFPRDELPGSIILELVDVPRPQFSYRRSAERAMGDYWIWPVFLT